MSAYKSRKRGLEELDELSTIADVDINIEPQRKRFKQAYKDDNKREKVATTANERTEQKHKKQNDTLQDKENCFAFAKSQSDDIDNDLDVCMKSISTDPIIPMQMLDNATKTQPTQSKLYTEQQSISSVCLLMSEP